MKQEEKELLLKDLSARLTYGVKVNNEIQGDFKIYGICENFVFGRNEVCHIDFDIEKIKPYLFPLSSMTPEQRTSYKFLSNSGHRSFTGLIDFFNKNHLDYRGLIEKGLALDATGLNVYN